MVVKKIQWNQEQKEFSTVAPPKPPSRLTCKESRNLSRLCVQTAWPRVYSCDPHWWPLGPLSHRWGIYRFLQISYSLGNTSLLPSLAPLLPSMQTAPWEPLPPATHTGPFPLRIVQHFPSASFRTWAQVYSQISHGGAGLTVQWGQSQRERTSGDSHLLHHPECPLLLSFHPVETVHAPMLWGRDHYAYAQKAARKLAQGHAYPKLFSKNYKEWKHNYNTM